MKDLWVPLSGAIAQQRKVETIANNVANANTPGFKRDQVTFKEYMTALNKGVEDIDLPNKEWAPQDFYRSYGAENAQVEVDASYTIFEQGQMRPTKNPLDIALFGNGFIEVLTPNGIRYTRRGMLSLENDGTLVTDKGHKVLMRSEIPANATDEQLQALPKPEDRVIKIPNGQVSINLQGEVFSNDLKVGHLTVREFHDQQALRKEGSSLYINKDLSNIKTTPLKTAIHQGYVEESNVNAIHEMSELIKAHRHFESIQNVIKTYDNISSKGVNEISKF
ncbi:flagellar hook-basal body protein [Halobacteriovorax sp. GB3]|uniref:flagellar hook-basal body protein n=1 Tax=Halobacteriovorax sp. GB3 TaxID=2719615 RepID=UPI00236262BD|nr:flagellar hook-basal body protein [Halobacteriovorax sp. GB3]MDD0854826.1 flagellar hook-basal body protein [Halobacteriovorax sp. GB3]